MVWMLTGAVLFNLLTSYLSAGLTVLTVQDNFKLYGMEVDIFFCLFLFIRFLIFLVSRTPSITVLGTEGLSWINIRLLLLLLLLLRLEMGLMTEIMFVRITSPERLVL